MGPRILITDNDLGDSSLEVDILRTSLEAQVEVRLCRTEEEVLAAVLETDPEAIIVQWAPITRRVLEAAPACKVISRIGIGTDMIDSAAAAALGIPVVNVPHYCTEEVATHAVAMIFALNRRLLQLDESVRAGIWAATSHAPEIQQISSLTLGLIGMGRIGRLVAEALAVWGVRVIVADPIAGHDPYERVSLGKLAAESDIISLHAPLVAETRHIVDASLVSLMRQRPTLINVSRGGLVDTHAVVAALADGRLSGAGLDVFETEPLDLHHQLLSVPNTILTPHAAWCSSSALPELRRQAALNVVRSFTTSGGQLE
jgi:D-3-phosphoglycerate dehydrogenase